MNSLMMAATVVGAGDGLIRQIVAVLIVGACLGILFLIGRWLIKAFGGSENVQKGWLAVFVLLGGLALINFLLTLIDKPFIRW